MKINEYYAAHDVVIYTEQTETKKSLSPYITKGNFEDVDIFGEPITNSSDYMRLEVEGLVPCNNNPKHIAAKKRRGECFIVLEPNTLQGLLYIPSNKVLTHEVQTEKKDYKGRGCVAVSFNDLMTFGDGVVFYVMSSRFFFAKGSDPAPKGSVDFDRLEEKIEKLKNKPSLFASKDPTRTKRLIALYEQKLAEGFEYICWQYRAEWKKATSVLFEGCVDHYEKSPEYLKLEKLTKELKTINEKWSEDDTIALQKIFKLTKKRNGGSK